MKVNRIAVSALFFMNGFIHANWAARLPEIEQFLEISHAQLGTLLFTLALGAISAMPFTGWLSTRFGGQRVTTTAAILLCLSSAAIPWQNDYFIESIIFFLVGFANGAMDVAMNEQAVIVERNWKKPIMSSFHAFWSIGMAVGAGTGALYSKVNIALTAHLLSITAIGLIFIIVTYRHLIRLRSSKTGGFSFAVPHKAIVPLGLIAFCGMLAEGSLVDWSAIYMNQVVGQTETMSAIAFGCFGAAMMTGRIIGDYLTHRLGKKKLLLLDGVLALLGLGITLSFVSTWTTLVGFFFAGVGLSTVVPIVYTTAGNTPGLSPSVGIAMATTIGYAGFFVGPPVIGYLADTYGLRIGMGFALLLIILMLVLITGRQFNNREV